MNKRQVVIALSVAFILLVMLLIGSTLSAKNTTMPSSEPNITEPNIIDQDPEISSGVTFAMDTIIEQKLYGKNSKTAYDRINTALYNIEDKVSLHKENTDVDKLNKSAGKDYVEISDITAYMLRRAKMFSEMKVGGFDTTIAPLAMLWDITGDKPRVPAQSEIDSILPLIDSSAIEIITDGNKNKAKLLKEGMAIDLGGIAKGASCDMIREIAKVEGIESGFVSLGGNMMVIGTKPDGENFVFGLRDPFGDANDYFGTVEIPDKTMATTGAYERFFEKDGVRYHHVLDPLTGSPAITDLASVTIISEDGALADYLSTELFMQGVEGISKLTKNDDFDMIAVDKDNTIYILGDVRHDFKPKSASQKTVYLSE